MDTREIFEIIAAVRKKKKITQQEMADKLELKTRLSYARYESGKISISLDKFVETLDILDINIIDLFIPKSLGGLGSDHYDFVYKSSAIRKIRGDNERRIRFIKNLKDIADKFLTDPSIIDNEFESDLSQSKTTHQEFSEEENKKRIQELIEELSKPKTNYHKSFSSEKLLNVLFESDMIPKDTPLYQIYQDYKSGKL